jgi:uncharacterized membrane protein
VVKLRSIGNTIAPPRFLIFMAVIIVGVPLAAVLTHSWTLGVMIGFDLAAILFLAVCIPLLNTQHAATIRAHASRNDANRTILLVITAIVMTVLLVAITAEAAGRNPTRYTKALIIGTLAIAWLYANTIYALHYAHLAYVDAEAECTGFRFPQTPEPVYWDFVYFAFTCGMAFATSDVEVTNQQIRRIVTFHCLAAFAFNIGVLAFTINLLASGGG